MVCKANNNSKLFHFLIKNENSLCVGEQIKYDSLPPQSPACSSSVLRTIPWVEFKILASAIFVCTTGWLGQMLSQKNTLTFYDSFY